MKNLYPNLKHIMPKSCPKITSLDTNSFIYEHNTDFELVNGEKLSHLQLAYETYGTLNTKKDNVILLHHSLSMSAHAYNYLSQMSSNKDFDYDHKSNAGWWDNMIGKGKPIDTEKYFIVCINNLGSCFGSSGPSNYHTVFPVITIHDMVRSQKLVLEHLGIQKLKLITGSSVGGMLSLAWLQLYPETVQNLFVAACAHKAYPTNIYNRMIQQEIIKLDMSDSKQGLKIARMLGFFNYRSNQELTQRFNESGDIFNREFSNHNGQEVYKSSEIYKYFSYNADKFINNFDTDSYLCLLNAMDLYDLTLDKEYHPKGYTNINKSTKITVVGIDSDILFPMEQQLDVYYLLKDSGYDTSFIVHKSRFGHDAFLIEYQQFGNYLQDLLKD